MKILTVDVGTGTQDILLYNPDLDAENSLKMVLPAPTMIFRRKIQMATQTRQPVLLTGVIMGGGPVAWAVEDHIKAGLRVFATENAALSFHDHLERVQEMGVTLVSEDEAARLKSTCLTLELCDFDYHRIQNTLQDFGISLDDLAAVAVSVFDHGAAPVGISDRQFRFDYLASQLQINSCLETFSFPADQIPHSMTRMQAVSQSARTIPAPLILMDSAPAAILGAMFDPAVKRFQQNLLVNIGNFHTLAFRMNRDKVEGVFEHHTGLLNQLSLEQYLRDFASGNLSHEAVFSDHGHGALIMAEEPLQMNQKDFNLIVTGPRRNLLKNSPLRPHFAVPLGDMMIAGCFGLLAATAHWLPEIRPDILKGLDASQSSGTAPWDIT